MAEGPRRVVPVIFELLAAGGQVCYRACEASAASGARMEATPDQMLILTAIPVIIIFALACAILDIAQWREKEKARKKAPK